MTISVSNTTLAYDLVIEAVLGVLGFFLSERYRRVRGVTPWRCPSGVWAAVWFLFPLVGALVYAIACVTTRPPLGPGSFAQRGSWSPPGTWPPPSGWGTPGRTDAPPGWAAPPPGGWEAPPPPGTRFPGPEIGPQQTPEPSPSPKPGPRAWLADPSGRHELRYFDGTRYTEHVSDGNKISVDPL